MDDAYYYLSLGRNVSRGLGPIIDSLHVTNGFQPLWAGIVILVCTLIPDSLAAAHALQVAGLVEGLFIGLLLYSITFRLSSSRLAALTAALFWILSPIGIATDLGLMETSLATLASLAMFYVFFLDRKRSKVSRFLVCGLVTGFSFLARVDTLLLLGSIGVVLVTNSMATQRGAIRFGGTSVAAFLAGSFLPVLPWAVFCLQIGKSILPESGLAVRQLATIIFDVRDFSLSDYVNNVRAFTGEWVRQLPIVNLAFGVDPSGNAVYRGTVFLDLLATVIVIGTVYLAWRSRNQLLLKLSLAWSVYLMVMTFSYTVIVPANWFWYRYTVPMIALLIPLGMSVLGVPLPRLINSVSILPHWSSAARVLCYATVGLAIVLAGSGYLLMLAFDTSESSNALEYYQAAQYLNNTAQGMPYVGAFSSGRLGYFAQKFKIVNLDGKINSDAYDAIATNSLWNYLCRANIEYLADWQTFIDSMLISRTPEADWHKNNLILEAQLNRVYIYKINRAACPPTSAPGG